MLSHREITTHISLRTWNQMPCTYNPCAERLNKMHNKHRWVPRAPCTASQAKTASPGFKETLSQKLTGNGDKHLTSNPDLYTCTTPCTHTITHTHTHTHTHTYTMTIWQKEKKNTKIRDKRKTTEAGDWWDEKVDSQHGNWAERWISRVRTV
jgi:hypothetical protein